MSKGKEIVIYLVIAALLLGGSYWWGGEQAVEGGGGNKGTIKIGYNNWAENIAVTHMWKLLLEEKGYSVELVRTEKAPLWSGAASGSIDVVPEAWLPTTDQPFYSKHKDKLELHEPWYEGTNLGLAVPSYVDVDSIEELNEKKDLFQRKGQPTIVGIDPGASLTSLTEESIKEYNLDYKLLESSEPAMLSELDKAIQKKEPILVTLWNPHWIFSKYEDLKYLKDPKNVYGEKEDIFFVTREGFKKEHPDVVKWMNQWQMDDQSLGSLMQVIEETGDPENGAEKWIEENREQVDRWLK